VSLSLNHLRADLLRDEGKRNTVYKCTANKATVGVGRNLDDVGCTADELAVIGLSLDEVKAGAKVSDAAIAYMLDNDINRTTKELDEKAPWWRNMPEPAQRGLANMLFNLGWTRLSGFKNMLAALKEGRYADAADHALKSKWATQVGQRAIRISELYQSSVGHPFS
jgi:lysozyme